MTWHTFEMAWMRQSDAEAFARSLAETQDGALAICDMVTAWWCHADAPLSDLQGH